MVMSRAEDLEDSIEGKVTAIAKEIGLVVLSVGTDDGVREGDEFTIIREGTFIATIRIDRSDRKWCAGKVELKTGEPRVADVASNHIFVSSSEWVAGSGDRSRAGPCARLSRRGPGPAERARRRALPGASASDHLVPSWQDAGVSVEEASEDFGASSGSRRGS